jgi:RNase P subunit RPR2
VIDPYLLAFLLIVLIGSVTVYIYYLKEKNEHLESINRGFCPKCHKKSMELTDQRSSGCSGPKIVTFECTSCGYTNSFAVESGGSCGSGSCR